MLTLQDKIFITTFRTGGINPHACKLAVNLLSISASRQYLSCCPVIGLMPVSIVFQESRNVVVHKRYPLGLLSPVYLVSSMGVHFVTMLLRLKRLYIRL